MDRRYEGVEPEMVCSREELSSSLDVEVEIEIEVLVGLVLVLMLVAGEAGLRTWRSMGNKERHDPEVQVIDSLIYVFGLGRV